MRKKKAAYLIGSMILAMNSVPAYAVVKTGQSAAGFAIKPKFSNSQDAELPRSGFDANVADAKVASKLVETISKSNLYHLDQATLDRISGSYLKNRTLQDMVKSILGQSSHAAKDGQVREINELRLSLASYLGDVDPAALHQKQTAETAAQNDLATVVMGINPLGLTAGTKANIIYFLTTLKNAISEGARLEDALKMANEMMALEKGVEVELESIQLAARGSGVAELFKDELDIRELVVQGPTGAALTVRMPVKEATAIAESAVEKATTLIEMARSPDLARQIKEQVMRETGAKLHEVEMFMKDNPLLDRQSSKFNEMSEATTRVSTSIDQLLAQLQELDAVVGGRGIRQQAARLALKYLPGADKVIKDPAVWKRTIREKITEIDAVLIDGVQKLDNNNQTLNSLKAQALTRIAALQAEIAEIHLISTNIKAYIDQIEGTNPELAKLIASELVPKVERDRNAVLSLYGVLMASIEAMNPVIQQNNLTITSTLQLRTVAAPVIAITESVIEASKDTAKVIAQSQAVSRFVGAQLLRMTAEIENSQKAFAKSAGESIVDPVLLEQVLTKLATLRETKAKQDAAAGEKLRTSNEKLINVLNRATQTLKQDQLGTQVNGVLRTKGNKPK